MIEFCVRDVTLAKQNSMKSRTSTWMTVAERITCKHTDGVRGTVRYDMSQSKAHKTGTLNFEIDCNPKKILRMSSSLN